MAEAKERLVRRKLLLQIKIKKQVNYFIEPKDRDDESL
jgi:hypothetical protein